MCGVTGWVGDYDCRMFSNPSFPTFSYFFCPSPIFFPIFLRSCAGQPVIVMINTPILILKCSQGLSSSSSIRSNLVVGSLRQTQFSFTYFSRPNGSLVSVDTGHPSLC